MIFDCHVHLPSASLGETWEWEACTPDVWAAAEYLRRCGVDRALANSMRGEVGQTPEDMVIGNDEAVEAAREHPDLFVPAGLINTNFGEQSLAEIRRCHDELGMVWIGELCGYAGGYTYDTDSFSRALGLAAELNMVVQVHIDAPEMDRLCRAFPEVTFVMPHLGAARETIRARCALAAEHPNLYLDICGSGYERMGVLELAVRSAGADRVLFGSDYTINDPAAVMARVRMSGLSEEAKGKILGGNVLRLLGERGAR